MAMVPTYKRQNSVPGSTGMQNIPLSLASSPLSDIGEGITKIGAAAGKYADAKRKEDAIVATRIQTREDVINSQRAIELFKQNEDLEYQRFAQKTDMLNTGSIAVYQQELKERVDNAAFSFPLSPDALVNIQAKISSDGSTYFRNMLKASFDAQERFTIDGTTAALESNLLPFGSDPNMDESKINQQKAIVLQTVAERSANLNSLAEQDLIKKGNALAYNNAFDSYFASGNFTEAKNLINSEDYRLSVDEAQYKTAAKALLDEEKSQRAGYDAGEKELQRQAAILGVPVSSFTPAQRLAISSLGAANVKLNPTEKAAEWERNNKTPPPPELLDSWITGKETPGSRIIQTNAILRSLGQPLLTDDQLKRFNQVEKAAGNNTENERRTKFLIENAPLYRAGKLNPEDKLKYEMLAQDEYNGSVTTAPDTDGNIVVVSTPLNQSIQAALDAQGFKIEEPGRVTERQVMDYKAPDIPETQTMFGMYKAAAGVGPGVQTFAANVPFLGELVPGESQIAQTAIRSANRQLIRSMQNNPKFNEGERKAIEKDLELDPKAFTSSKAYFSRMVAVQRFVDTLIGQKRAILYSNAPKKDRELAGRNLIDLLNYDKIMGMPLISAGPEDPRLDDLNPGDIFVDSSTGVIYAKTMPESSITEGL